MTSQGEFISTGSGSAPAALSRLRVDMTAALEPPQREPPGGFAEASARDQRRLSFVTTLRVGPS